MALFELAWECFENAESWGKKTQMSKNLLDVFGLTVEGRCRVDGWCFERLFRCLKSGEIVAETFCAFTETPVLVQKCSKGKKWSLVQSKNNSWLKQFSTEKFIQSSTWRSTKVFYHSSRMQTVKSMFFVVLDGHSLTFNE